MKTKAQKNEELERGRKFLKESSILVFADVTKVPAEELGKLRRELTKMNSTMLVMKKRLLGIILKESGIEFNPRDVKTSMGTVFSSAEPEVASAAVFKFFKTLNLEKEKIVGGYDIQHKRLITAEQIRFLGQLPSREVLLAQLLGQFLAPLRSFMYLLDQKSKKVAG